MKKTQVKGMKQCASKLKSSAELKSVVWSDLDLNLVGEIKKRLYWTDHVRFGGVCKNWQAAQHEKRAADVLPWLMNVRRENIREISYSLYEPSAPHVQPPIVHGIIALDQIFHISCMRIQMNVVYRDGCLCISMFNKEATCSYVILYTLATKNIIKLPQFNHPRVPEEFDKDMFWAVSTKPTSPDCVFFVLYISNNHKWSTGIYRHGDTDWSITEFEGDSDGIIPFVDDVVFIRGVFYFLCTDYRLGSYDISSEELKLEFFSSTIDYRDINKFFGLDGELMLAYHDFKARKFFITSYDWAQKVWVPLKSLGDRSLFLSNHSVYVDAINYYGVSANKIYIREHGTCNVYSLDNGELLESTSSGLRNWDGLDYYSGCTVWVEPPHLLPK
ncbi:hypothetical protein POM88_026915 [Heracleum sosnowskyi]|uniref:KIB1-4 beta-propeller domain-containing protein n=1 Tax=Heracleum sosnowskyi TaxID=360622 RepID=A0AAD8I800_9APIA|nr:hypothetical protein POM88_026915 [Heracleum sosnowskyi]